MLVAALEIVVHQVYPSFVFFWLIKENYYVYLRYSIKRFVILFLYMDDVFIIEIDISLVYAAQIGCPQILI